MSYLTRSDIIFDNDTFHVTWQCHNKDWLLKEEWAKEKYYNLLLKYKDKYGVVIYSYNFMDNHPHLSGKLTSRELFSNFFKLINSLFAKEVNHRLKRRGQVIMDRFKSPRIEDDRHLLSVMTYIDLNQMKVGKVDTPENNTWSSYNYYAYGTADKLLTPAPSYLGLAETDADRQECYRNMVYALAKAKGYLNISHTYFIGNPDWVKVQYEQLHEKLRQKKASKPPKGSDEDEDS